MHAPAIKNEHTVVKKPAQRLIQKIGIFFRYIKYFSSFNPRSFWTGIAASYLRAPVNTAIIYCGGILIDSIVSYYEKPQFAQILSLQIPYPAVLIVVLFILWFTKRILSYIITREEILIHHRAWDNNRIDIVKKFGILNQEDIESEDVKDEIEKILNFWYGRATGLYFRIRDFGELLINIVAAFIAVWTFQPVFAIIILLLPLPEIVVIARNNKRFVKFVDDIAPLLLRQTYFFNLLIDTRIFAEKKINSIFKLLQKTFAHHAHGITKGYEYVQTKQEKYVVIASVVDGLGLYIVEAIMVLQGIMTQVAVGRISYTLGYMDSLYSRLYNIGNTLLLMMDDLTYINKHFELMDRVSISDKLKGKRVITKKVPSIEFKNFSYTYRDSGITVLNNAQLSIAPGEKVMILGKDGSGKSSILKFLAHLFDIQEGDILIDGVSMNSLKAGSIRDKLSVVAEDFARFYLPLKDNITLGDPEKPFDPALYAKVLEATGLTEWVKQVGLDDDQASVGSFFEGGVEVSSGHWQRIAIARALYRNRDIFIFDQPFTYVDKASVHEIFPKILDFIGDRTLIFIGEEVIFQKDFDSFYEVGGGQIKKLTEKDIKGKWHKKS